MVSVNQDALAGVDSDPDSEPQLPGQAHFDELSRRHHRFLHAGRFSKSNLPKTRKPRPFLDFAIHTYRNLFLTFFFNWYMIFIQPLNATLTISVFPTIVAVLLVLELGLRLFLVYLGGNSIVSKMSAKYGGGLTMVNWGQPDLFTCETTAAMVSRGIPQLTIPPSLISITNPTAKRKFNLSIAEILLVLAALTYERDDSEVQKAFKEAADNSSKKDNGNDGNALSGESEAKAREQIQASEAKIKAFSAQWGLGFESVSELKSDTGGPFVGLFWKEDSNFLILSFKGTTPTDYSEFLVDATIQRTDGRPFVFGEVHEGFYNALFPSTGLGAESDPRNPYGTIITGIRSAAKRLRRKNGNQTVQLWITGHSLGAALATVLFSRLLKCPGDLGDGITLRDIYCFGTPAIGDNDFAAIFASHTNDTHTSTNPTSTLWRVINSTDIISRLPVSSDDPTVARFLTRDSFFNYSHVGIAVQLHGGVKKPTVNSSVFQSAVEVEVVLQEDAKSEPYKSTKVSEMTTEDAPAKEKGLNPIAILESLYPSFFHNHFPRLYLNSLEGAFEALEKNPDKKPVKGTN